MNNEKPRLHFGASLPFGPEDTIFQSRWMEDLGYEYLAAGEHFMRGNPPTPTDAVLPVLGVAAGATEKIRILSSILLAPFYHPTVLAKLTNTLDIASGGRLTLGIGVGGEFPMEFEAAGLAVKQRGRRTDECLEILRKLWIENNVSYNGRHFQIEDVSINPPPFQDPHPPIWVAGRRDAAMQRAALFGEGWLPYFYSPERYRDSREKIQNMASASGRKLGTKFEWAFFPYISIYPSVEEASTIAAESLGSQYLYGGDFQNIVNRYCILGPPEQCIDRLEEYVNAGATHIIFSPACPMEDRARHMETIIKEIIPGLNERVAATG